MTTLDSIKEFQIYLCDFYDSYTYNLFSDLSLRGYNVKVFNYEDEEVFSELIRKKQRSVLVLGPGPGHPDEYFNFIHKKLKLCFNNENIFILGVCLGHQLLGKLLGQCIVASKKIKHGRTSSVFFDGKCIDAQRYNSLCVEVNDRFKMQYKCYFDEDAELSVIEGESFISTQFHPESVGTSCPSSVYKRIDDFLV